MASPSFPDEYYINVDQFRQEMAGREFRAHDPQKDHFICDFCSIGVPYEKRPTIGMYFADDLLGVDHPNKRKEGVSQQLVPLATYCEDCTTKRLLFPCQGFTEVRIILDLTKDRVMENVQITDISPKDDGIPWDPEELSEEITGVSFQENAFLAGPDMLWGPENMITFFLSFGQGIDPRELIRWDGELNRKQLGRARKEYEKTARKMRKQNYDRKAFRDHVRNNS